MVGRVREGVQPMELGRAVGGLEHVLEGPLAAAPHLLRLGSAQKVDDHVQLVDGPLGWTFGKRSDFGGNGSFEPWKSILRLNSSANMQPTDQTSTAEVYLKFLEILKRNFHCLDGQRLYRC